MVYARDRDCRSHPIDVDGADSSGLWRLVAIAPRLMVTAAKATQAMATAPTAVPTTAAIGKPIGALFRAPRGNPAF